MTHPILSQITLAVPERLVWPPAWAGHIPFAFWLVEAQRPNVIVELGTHTGNSYLAFAQAVRAVGLSTACYAIDTWEGDEHSGFYGPEVYDELLAYHDVRYKDFSRLVRSTFDNAVSQFSDDSIDLLHIDGLHTYEAVKHDFETYLPKLSSRGIVLLHDMAVRGKDFGVWKFWEEIRQRHPHFEFDHSNGLGVLGIGSDFPEAVEWLFRLTRHGQEAGEAARVRSIFERLGSPLIAGVHRPRSGQPSYTAADLERRIRELRLGVQRRDDRIDEIVRIATAASRAIASAWTEQADTYLELQRKLVAATIPSARGRPKLAAHSGSGVKSLLSRTFSDRRTPTAMAAGQEMIKQSGLFDVEYYLSQLSSSHHSPTDAIVHYLEKGDLKGIKPNALFDPNYYRSQYKDVLQNADNTLLDYIKFGLKKGRRPNQWFRPRWYIKKYGEVKSAGIDPLIHYANIGFKEGFDPSEEFDAKWYTKFYGIPKSINPLAFHLDFGVGIGLAVSADQEQRKRGLPAQVEAATKLAKGAALAARTPEPTGVQQQHHEGWNRYVPLLRELGDEGAPGDKLPRGFINACWKAVEAHPLRVSVIVPTWNRAHVIERALSSLFRQSYPVAEVIVVDDGSEDDTAKVIAERFRDALARGVLVFVQRPHQGISSARNVGLEYATGDLIAYLDSDNYWRDDFALVMSAVFAQSPVVSSAYCARRIHDAANGDQTEVTSPSYNRRELLKRNSIDLNCFVHRRQLSRQHGGFDEKLRRLIDWEFVLRLTEHSPPVQVPVLLVEYFLDEKGLRNTTFVEDFDPNYSRVAALRRRERLAFQIDPLRLAYVLWDFPALSQTFVINELRRLCELGVDVRVYFKTAPDRAATLDFDVKATQVSSAEELASQIRRDRRNMIHAHFVYPACTLLAWPAARESNTPFTFTANGVDVTLHKNRGRNRVGEIARDPLCVALLTLGTAYRELLVDQGVPSEKLVIERQAVDLPRFQPRRHPASPERRPVVVSIGRFVEKKGHEYLIRAAALMPEVDVVLYGYGGEEARLRDLASSLPATNVSFGGVIEGAEALAEAYRAADVFALPCVEASNGDLDGLPTVLLEAMAAGVPVVTTAVANIPDLVIDGVTGFVARDRDVDSLVSALHRALGLDDQRLARITTVARRYVEKYSSVEQTVRTLLSTWNSRTIDIVLVTYDTPEHDDWIATKDIIDRIYRHTATPFTLIVVDNNSQASFRDKIIEHFGSKGNFVYVPLERNIFVGPATNIGLDIGHSEYVVYLCSKEAFILQNGWERRLIEAMDHNVGAAMGGYPVLLANYPTGADYSRYPSFEKWRNPEFAERNPDRQFYHLQGGVLIIRRSVYESLGGFSDQVPQNGTDVEYSYYLESCGYELAAIDDIYAITTATRPAIHTLVDENTLLAHPLTPVSAAKFDHLAARRVAHCNLCDWQGPAFNVGDGHSICPNCGSTPFARSAMRCLSMSGELQRRPGVMYVGNGAALKKALDRLCPDFLEIPQRSVAWVVNRILEELGHKLRIIIIDHAEWGPELLPQLVDAITQCVQQGARCVVGERLSQHSSDETIFGLLRARGLELEDLAYVSRCAGYDPLPVGAIGLAMAKQA